MMSLKALMSAEEGRAGSSSSAASPASSSGAELGSWLSDYNSKGRGLASSAVHSASSSVSGLFSSLTSSSSASASSAISSSSSSPSSTSASASVNPDATSSSSISSSWFAWSLPSAESQSLTTSSSASTPTSSSASSWLSSIPGYGEDANVCFGLSWQQRLGLFFLSFLAGVLMLGLSFTFLSLVLLGQSSKFTMAYALANVFFLLSSSFLTGPYAQLTSMFHPSRFLISSLYLGSLALTLFCAWQVRVFYVVLPLLVVQVACLLAYVASYLPFGLPMMKRTAGLFFASFRKLLLS